MFGKSWHLELGFSAWLTTGGLIHSLTIPIARHWNQPTDRVRNVVNRMSVVILLIATFPANENPLTHKDVSVVSLWFRHLHPPRLQDLCCEVICNGGVKLDPRIQTWVSHIVHIQLHSIAALIDRLDPTRSPSMWVEITIPLQDAQICCRQLGWND